MRKLTILLPLLAVFAFLAIAGTITGAGSSFRLIGSSEKADPNNLLEQANKLSGSRKYKDAEKLYLQIKAENPGSDKAIEAQKQIVHIAVITRDKAKADAAFSQMVSEFARNQNIADAIYSIGSDYGRARNNKKAIEIYTYNVTHFPDTVSAMKSEVEIIRTYLRSKNALADKEIDNLKAIFYNQPDLPKVLYQLGQSYIDNKLADKGLMLNEDTASTYPDNVYGQLSQIRYFAQTQDYARADTASINLLSNNPDSDAAKQGLLDLASFNHKNKQYERAIAIYMDQIENWPDFGEPVNPYREAIYCYIDMNDTASVDNMMYAMRTNLAEDPKLARAHFDIGNYFLYNAKDSANALKIHEYNVEQYTNIFESMWSQAALVWYYVRHGEQANADIEYSKLLAIYHDQKTLPKEVFQIGDIYLEVGDSEKARALYQQVMNEWPSSEYVFNARAGLIKADIFDGSDTTVMTDINDLITDYKDKSELPYTVFQFGEKYWDLGQVEKRKDNPMNFPTPNLQAEQKTIISDKTKGYYTNAQNIWEKIIQDIPSSFMETQAYCYAAEASKIIGENDKAIEYFQTVVDKWPDYNMASHCLNMIADIYNSLQKSGALSQSDAESKMKAVYERIAADYPDSAPGLYADWWVKNYEAKEAIQQIVAEAQKHRAPRSGRLLNLRINNSNEGAEQ